MPILILLVGLSSFALCVIFWLFMVVPEWTDEKLGRRQDHSQPTQVAPDWRRCTACGKWLPPARRGLRKLLFGSGQGHYCRWWASP